MPSLVLEGGTLRPIFSCGVMDALLDAGLMFDYVIGVSAGITYATSYISRQRGRNIEILRRYRNDKRYLSARNLIRERSVFGLNFSFDLVPNRLVPFDWATFRAYKGKFIVGLTHARTGGAVYRDGLRLDKKSMLLRATCAIPLLLPPVQFDGRTYFDGGLADPIPIAKSLKDGNRKHLIVLTQPEGFVKTHSRLDRVAMRRYEHRWPTLCHTLHERPARYNQTVAYCEQLVRENPKNTVLLRPKAPLASFEKDVNVLQQSWQQGYQLARDRMDEIAALFD